VTYKDDGITAVCKNLDSSVRDKNTLVPETNTLVPETNGHGNKWCESYLAKHSTHVEPKCGNSLPILGMNAKVGLLQNQPTVTWCDTDDMGGATGHARR